MKLCVVGLDGATWDLLDPWLDDLPTIRRIAGTFRSRLDSCTPPISVPAWKVYTTGMDPGALGVFTFVEPDFEDRRLRTVSSETFTHREIWDYLGDEGHRSTVVNVPSTAPPRDIDGWLVSGPFSDVDDYARPRSFQRELDAAGYTILPDYYLSRDPDDVPTGVESVRGKFDAALRHADEADFVHVTVYLTDTVQHTEWDSPVSRTFWRAVDRELGRFLDRLGDGWNVVLMSDHGFGATEGIFYLNTWLEEHGYMHLDRSGVDLGDLAGWLGLDYLRAKRLLTRLHLLEPLKAALPSETLLRLARQLPGNRKLEGIQDKLDWDSDAIALAPLIYTKTPAVAEEIREELLALRDRNGDPIVERVYDGAELYPDCEVRAPDLVIDHTRYVISDVVNPGQRMSYDRDEWAETKIAHHRHDGILAAAGPDVRPDVVGVRNGHRPALVDLAPTVLDAFGVTVPETMSGRSLGLLGGPGHRGPVRDRRDAERVVVHDAGVEQKLKDLGYL